MPLSQQDQPRVTRYDQYRCRFLLVDVGIRRITAQVPIGLCAGGLLDFWLTFLYL